MIRYDLAKKLAYKLNVSHSKADEIIKIFIDGIIAGVNRDGRVMLYNFGIFAIKKMKPRIYINIRTGVKFNKPARNFPVFHPSKFLKRMVNINRRTSTLQIGEHELK